MKKVPLHSIGEAISTISIFLKNLYITKTCLSHQNTWKYMGNNFLKLVELIQYEDPQNQIYHCLILVRDWIVEVN